MEKFVASNFGGARGIFSPLLPSCVVSSPAHRALTTGQEKGRLPGLRRATALRGDAWHLLHLQLLALQRDVAQVAVGHGTDQGLLEVGLGQRGGQGFKLGIADPALAPADFLGAADLQALALLQRLHERASLQQAVMGAGVQPSVATAEDLHVQFVGFQVAPVQVGDLQFAAGARARAGATEPFVWIMGWIGWRWGFSVAILGLLVSAVLMLFVVRDAPPGSDWTKREPEPLLSVIRGLGEIFRHPAMPGLIGAALIGYSTNFAIRGLWLGLYMVDVHGLGTSVTGRLLFAMAALGTVGLHVEKLLQGTTPKKVESALAKWRLGLPLSLIVLLLGTPLVAWFWPLAAP